MYKIEWLHAEHINNSAAPNVGLDQRSCSTFGPVSTWMSDRLWASITISVCNQPPRSTQPSILPG